jgi:DNA-binding protein HU-beta
MPKGKQDLIDAVAEEIGQGQKFSKDVVEAVLNGISTLAAEDRLTLRGFGTFETRTRAARQGRNPRTGETIALAASSALAFRAAKPTAD